jgi:predicted N-acyltransferase
VLYEGKTALAAALPLYVKGHSYGEYVFDWAWADAYQRNGLDYYPKLLSAPSPSRR